MEQIEKNISKFKEHSTKISQEVKQKTLGFIITAFGLVAGLAWNEAIQAIIKQIFPLDKNSLIAKLIYAILMTLLLVVITVYLTRLIGKNKDSEQNK